MATRTTAERDAALAACDRIPSKALDVWTSSAFFDGGCQVCVEPVKGTLVTQVKLGDELFRLCYAHTAKLSALLERRGLKREI